MRWPGRWLALVALAPWKLLGRRLVATREHLQLRWLLPGQPRPPSRADCTIVPENLQTLLLVAPSSRVCRRGGVVCLPVGQPIPLWRSRLSSPSAVGAWGSATVGQVLSIGSLALHPSTCWCSSTPTACPAIPDPGQTRVATRRGQHWEDEIGKTTGAAAAPASTQFGRCWPGELVSTRARSDGVCSPLGSPEASFARMVVAVPRRCARDVHDGRCRPFRPSDWTDPWAQFDTSGAAKDRLPRPSPATPSLKP
jgi:hypothetical protein